MDKRCAPFRLLAPTVACLWLVGCAAQTVTSALPAAVALPKMTIDDTPGEPNRVAGSPTEVYSQIARGANSCWFAATGQLKATHIFHADAEPSSRGGAVEIAVHVRDDQNGKSWGMRVFRVSLTPAGEQTAIDVQNYKIPEETAALMRADVFHWAAGGTSCKLKPADVVVPPPKAKPATTKKRVPSKS